MPEFAKANKGLWGSSAGIAEDGQQFFKRFRSDIEVPIAGMPYESFITIEFRYPEFGLPGESDTTALVSFEDSLLKQLEDSETGRLVYVQTYDNHRVFLFYTKGDLSKNQSNVFSAIPKNYNVTLQIDIDPEWKFLFEVRNSYFQKLSSQQLN